ncbi:hypothetical protein SRB5_30390 [Streptomyces sp. RB5]|uniref:Uncharacterized protein n=1 Tax=Streptomyces smaragdinus TaxID=2585196 RepID=A0A7K0CHE0_9ACTN|nr:hypothetical protein [Streptomyces smaragdinus]MQY12900.1 hypothetical protein [Streptomyces smaragdinus]
MKYTLSEPQKALLRKLAAAPGPLRLEGKQTHTAWSLAKRGLVKRQGGPYGETAITPDGRYYLKHGKDPAEERAAKERLAGDAKQARLAPADGAELIARLRAAPSGKLTVADPAPTTRGRWRAAYYEALHHGHIPEKHKLRWSGRQRGNCVFTLIDEEAEKAAQPPPVPVVDVPELPDKPHRLVRATRKALGRSKTVVDTRDRADVIPMQ